MWQVFLCFDDSQKSIWGVLSLTSYVDFFSRCLGGELYLQWRSRSCTASPSLTTGNEEKITSLASWASLVRWGNKTSPPLRISIGLLTFEFRELLRRTHQGYGIDRR